MNENNKRKMMKEDVGTAELSGNDPIGESISAQIRYEEKYSKEYENRSMPMSEDEPGIEGEEKDEVEKVLNEINERFGERAVFRGGL